MASVTISTPQFKDGKISRMHTQTGTIEKRIFDKKFVFKPLNGFVNGDHTVIFQSENELEKFKVR